MSGYFKTTLLVLAALALAWNAPASDKPDKDDKKPRHKPEISGTELFKPTQEFGRRESDERGRSQQMDHEVASSAIPLPSQMDLETEWYTPHIGGSDSGNISQVWIKDELIFVETSKHDLITVRREDGVELWRCHLEGELKFPPAVSRNNVVVNIKNNLIAIEKSGGNVRWRIMPDFVMSNEPLVFDPPSYPAEYGKNWQNLENIYVGSYDGRFYDLYVRARMTQYAKPFGMKEGLAAPEFDLYPAWHKTHKKNGAVTTPARYKDGIIYYVADNNYVYAMTRDGDEREPYYMLAGPATPATVTANSIYVGARDNSVYCIDRLTMKKKWAFAAGVTANGNIFADDPATPYVYVAEGDGALHALKVTPSRPPSKTESEVLESFAPAWEIPGGAGTLTASPTVAYIGMRKDGEYYKSIAAVEKTSGRILWKADSSLFTRYIEFPNSWSNPKWAARVYATTSDGRLVSLKEHNTNTGVQEYKLAAPEPEAPTKPKKKEAASDATGK